MDTFLSRAKPTLGAESPEIEAARVVWRISVAGGEAYVEAYEQRKKSKGGFTKGRKITPQRLARSEELWTRPEVRAIASSVVEDTSYSYYGSYSETTYEFDQERALLELVGSPHVTWRERPEVPVRIAAGALGLTLLPLADGSLELVPTFAGLPLSSRDSLLVSSSGFLIRADRQGNRVTVGSAAGAVLELFKNLVSNPRSRVFPKGGQEELFHRLEHLEGLVPLEIPAELQGEPQVADSRVHLLLRPIEGGVAVSARVRPSGGSGEVFHPGAGGVELLAWIGGERIALRRDHEREVRVASEVSVRLGLASEEALGSELGPEWNWELEGERALDLVSAVQDEDPEQCVFEWPEGEGLTVSREVGPADLRVTVSDARDWFGLAGGVDIEGWKVPLATLLGLEEGERYLQLDKNRWLRVSRFLRERLASLRDVSHGSGKRVEVDATSAPVVEEFLKGVGHAELSQEWTDLLGRLNKARRVSTAPPKGLKGDLRPYQRVGFAWLKRLSTWGVGACLADDMGLGKTIQAIALLVCRARSGPALVVAPTSVASNWKREIERFAPRLRPVLYRETDRASALSEFRGGDVVVISYDLARIDREKLGAVEWGTLVFDEAQQVKNGSSKTARALQSLPGKWRLALTGTPVENHLGDLWGLFRLISPGVFGSWEAFKRRFATPIERDKDPSRRAALAKVIQPFMLRRTKAEVLPDLPKRNDVLLQVDLSSRERKAYEGARLAAIAALVGEGGGQDQRFQVLAAITKLRQLACHPALVDPSWREGSAKLRAFRELIASLREGGHRALVFSQFTRHLSLVRDQLDQDGISYLYLDGKTSAAKRPKLVDAFQGGEGDVFLISLKAGGKGLNLTGADYVVHLDPWWNPAVEDQATDRAHRIGQTKPVTVYRLVAKGTIEEQILELHASKRDLVAGVLDGTDRAGKLSADELLGLIRGEGRPKPAGKRPRLAPREVAPAPKKAGEGLRSFRSRHEITQAQLGSLLGVSAGTVCRWERGGAVPARREATLDALQGLTSRTLRRRLSSLAR
ncbi:MAG: helix-turn-helix domain-containing protein [Planctomycetes bacterium]|nr:helix-turn-helix domain-containing protein [Planctomycetota bacterium]